MGCRLSDPLASKRILGVQCRIQGNLIWHLSLQHGLWHLHYLQILVEQRHSGLSLVSFDTHASPLLLTSSIIIRARSCQLIQLRANSDALLLK